MCINLTFRASIYWRIFTQTEQKERGICMKKRYFLAALLLALTFLACCSIALADDDVPPPELISENVTFSVVDWHRNVMTIDDELKMTRMTAAISKVDSTHIYVKGVTQANKTCYRIGGYMTIQQWKENKWNYYTSVSYTDYGTHDVTGATTVSVTSGYYYRLIVSHYANHVDGDVYGTTNTSSILVN